MNLKKCDIKFIKSSKYRNFFWIQRNCRKLIEKLDRLLEPIMKRWLYTIPFKLSNWIPPNTNQIFMIFLNSPVRELFIPREKNFHGRKIFRFFVVVVFLQKKFNHAPQYYPNKKFMNLFLTFSLILLLDGKIMESFDRKSRMRYF